jgi:LAO/AO transport system kinase
VETGLAKRILEGDVRAASRLMRDIDDQIPSALEALKELYPKTGSAYIIGITGSPGSGKSTIVDKMIDYFRQEGKRLELLP